MKIDPEMSYEEVINGLLEEAYERIENEKASSISMIQNTSSLFGIIWVLFKERPKGVYIDEKCYEVSLFFDEYVFKIHLNTHIGRYYLHFCNGIDWNIIGDSESIYVIVDKINEKLEG